MKSAPPPAASADHSESETGPGAGALVSAQGLPWVCGPGKAIAACKVAPILHVRRAVPPFQGWILDGGTVKGLYQKGVQPSLVSR